MRSMVTVCLAAVLVVWGTAGRAGADTKAEIVSTSVAWEKSNHNSHPDLIRFGDRWFLACQESFRGGWSGGTVRVLTSKDGKAWESVAVIESPTANRGLYAPTFTLTPDGELMLSAIGFVGWPNPTDPITGSGGTQKSMAWVSKDGRDWGKPALIGFDDFPLGRVVWHNGIAFSPAIGCICGSAQTLQIMAGKDGKAFESRAEEHMRMLMPSNGDLLFEGETAYCLVTGYTTAGPAGVLGTAQTPYKAWEWKVLDQQVRHARFLRLPDKRVIATVGLSDQEKFRTALCEFHATTGKFTELVELPTGKQDLINTGLAWHDEHVWVSYSVAEGDKVRVEVANVKVH